MFSSITPEQCARLNLNYFIARNCQPSSDNTGLPQTFTVQKSAVCAKRSKAVYLRYFHAVREVEAVSAPCCVLVKMIMFLFWSKMASSSWSLTVLYLGWRRNWNLNFLTRLGSSLQISSCQIRGVTLLFIRGNAACASILCLNLLSSTYNIFSKRKVMFR